MSVDWNLLVGYHVEDAQACLRDEDVLCRVIQTASPESGGHELGDLRVVAVRNMEDMVELVCAREDWLQPRSREND